MAERRELLVGELDLTHRVWRKSTASGNDQTSTCLELTSLAKLILVRDSKNRAGPILVFSGDAWNELRARIASPLSEE